MNPQQQIDLSKTTPIQCVNCEGQLFHEALILRKESRFVSGLPFDRTVPIPVFACMSCGRVVEETVPEQLKDSIKEENDKE